MFSVDQLKKKLGQWWRPWYSLPFFVIMILVFLVFFGRSFAILCTSIGWYMLPTINATYEHPKRPRKVVKKEYSRKFSEKTVTSPRSVLSNGPTKTITSPRNVLNTGPTNDQAHRKSFWLSLKKINVVFLIYFFGLIFGVNFEFCGFVIHVHI